MTESESIEQPCGPAGEVFREAGDEAEAQRGPIEQAMAAALSDYLKHGKVVMPSSSWIVSADINPL